MKFKLKEVNNITIEQAILNKWYETGLDKIPYKKFFERPQDHIITFHIDKWIRYLYEELVKYFDKKLNDGADTFDKKFFNFVSLLDEMRDYTERAENFIKALYDLDFDGITLYIYLDDKTKGEFKNIPNDWEVEL